MNTLLYKIRLYVTGIMLLLGSCVWAGELTITPSQISGAVSGTATFEGFSFAASKANGASSPVVNATYGDLRVYANGTFRIQSDNSKITKIVFTLSAQGKRRLAPITPSVGSVAIQQAGDESVTWTGSAYDVTLTVGSQADYGSDGSSKAGQFCFDQIVLTTEDGGVNPSGQTLYTFKATIAPATVGSVTPASSRQLPEGATIDCGTVANANSTYYTFMHWVADDNTIVSTERNFTYTMPDHDVTLTAVYDYSPATPGNPSAPTPKYTVTLKTSPNNAGTFSWKTATQVAAATSCDIYAYANTGFVFREWQRDGETVSTSVNYKFQMPEEDVTLVAVYDYNPANPGNPSKGYWDETTGEVIIDDFSAGGLGTAINNCIGGSNNCSKVKMITVSGIVNQSDWGILNNHTNCDFLDMSRTGGLTYVPSYNFSGNTTLQTIILPASIESISNYAFQNCSQLSVMDIHAVTPPTVAANAFNGVTDLVVHVPADAVALYQEAPVWKDFTILPLGDDVSALEVNMPENVNMSLYKDMFLELINTKSGQKLRYVLTNRTTYTFNSLIHRTNYNVYLKNAQGYVLGEIDNVDIIDQDVSVTFDKLLSPRTLSLTVETPDGGDVSDEVSITWMDEKGNFLSNGNTIDGQMEGTTIKYRVTLPQDLAMEYFLPADVEYEVADANSITYTLTAIPQTTISGKVIDAKSGNPLSGATVAVSQMLNGLYSKSLTTKTDNQGNWSLQVYETKTEITASMDDYVSKTQTFETLVAKVPSFELKDINGTTISLALTYTDTSGETKDFYSDYANIAYTVFNETIGQAVTDMNVLYPQIVLMDQLPAGTALRVMATSKNQKFMPVTATGIVDDLNHVSVTLPIKQLGGITASFRQTDNPNVSCILYNASGQLINKYDYTSSTLTISDLQDGRYTLVSMASSQFFNSIGSVEQFAEAGLREGIDYVKNTVTVLSGEMAVVENALIPFFDESKFYYTSDGTSIAVNKSQITSGNYLTITGKIDFKPTYINNVGNVKLIVNLPEGTSFVENSVMCGNNTANYTYAGNQVVVPLDKYGERVRFCFIPTVGGDYAATAQVQFSLNGKMITQPIGTANFTVQDLSISVPSTVAKTSVPVGGTAPGKSSVEIYDNGVFVGQTTASANGSWTANIDLEKPYNLSKHSIYGKLTTTNGLEMLTETKDITYDMNCVEAKTVTMSFYNRWLNKNIEVVFDLHNKTVSQSSYMFSQDTDITFVADLTNNDTTIVNGVTIRIYTDQNNWRNLNAVYDAKTDKWVAVSQFGSNELPIGVDVVIYAKSETIADRDKIDEDLSTSNSLFAELELNMDRVNHLLSVNQDEETSESFTVLQNYLESDNYDASEVNKWIQSVMYNQTSGDVMTDEMADSLTILYQKDLDEFTEKLKNSPDSSVFALLYLPTELNLLTPTSEDVSFEHEGYTYKQKKWTPVSVENLLNEGFLHYNLTDSTQVFFKYENSGLIIIDTKKAVEFSMLPVDKANSQSDMPRRASNASGFALCVKDWNLLVANILNYRDINTNLDLKNVLTIATQVRGTIQGIIDASSCFYRDYYITFKYNLDNSYKKFVKEIEDKIEARRNLIDKHWERIKAQNDMISQQEDMIRQYQKNIDELSAQAYNTSDPNVLDELEKQIKHNEDLIKASQKHIKLNKQIISDINAKDINQIEKQINCLSKEREGIEEGYRLAKQAVDRIPTLSRGRQAVSVWTTLGRLAGPLGIICDVVDIVATGWAASDEIKEWLDLGDIMLRKLPCEGNPDEAELLCKDIVSNFIDVVVAYASILGTKMGAAALNSVDVPVFTPHWWIASGLNIYAEWANLWASNKYNSLRDDFWGRMYYLKCKKDDDKCPRCGQNPCVCPPPNPQIPPVRDPSGYVYEAVSSNRVQGATASVYYKETVEDMYGDLHENIALWNAEEYAQQNPLFTDENGMYRWDVPQGLWQVKFEKEGYETTYSEWLPVPPPQLDVNIAMRQFLQPTVKNVKAYADGIEMEFDKYMDPETLTPDNILVTKNGNAVNGTIKLLNEEVAYEGKTQTYASKVRFEVPEEEKLLTTDEVQLTVRRAVKSYAGTPMENDYTQQFDVELQVQSVVVDSLINVAYGGQRTIMVAALPVDAAKGKTIKVKPLSSMIAKADAETLTLDENGQAELTVTGELPGATAMSFAVDGTDVKGLMTVNVKDAANLVAIAPRASRVSGTEVYRGTQIRLTSETENAIIYYTLDGSCPCDLTSESVIKYNPDEPIIIADDNVIIKAMATGHDLGESDVAEFTYSLKKSTLGYQMPTGWSWISHNLEEPVPTTSFHANAERIVSQTAEQIYDPTLGFVGNLNELQPVETYKVKVSAPTENRLSGYEFNAVANSIGIATGWNWLGYPLNQTMSLPEAFAFFTPSEGDYIVGQDGFAEFSDSEWHGTLEGMVPGKGYMYKSATETEIRFNTTIVSEAGSKLGKRNLLGNSLWSYDKNAYPNIMPVIAELYDDRVIVDDDKYTVGAFSGSECRGIGQWKDGRLMLSIFGEGNEPIRFIAADQAGENLYDISETLAFEPDNKGTWHAPMKLTIGQLTTNINNLYDGLVVSPVVFSDHISVSVNGHGISRLTLTNMLGVNVIDISNLGTGGTVTTTGLADGVYVLMVQTEDRTYYKKIMKANI